MGTPAVAAAAADHLATKGLAWPLAGLWKREADAEAEPWLGYGYGLGAWGLGIKSAPCVNAANIPVPCRGIWKREAEAEPWLAMALLDGPQLLAPQLLHWWLTPM